MLCHETQINHKKYITEFTNMYYSSLCLHQFTYLSFSLVFAIEGTVTLKVAMFTPGFYFSGVRVTRSLVLYVCFVDHCLSFCPFSFGHCFVCSSAIYGLFWLPLWYLQTLLNESITTLHYNCEAGNISDLIKFDIFYNISIRHRSTAYSTRKPMSIS